MKSPFIPLLISVCVPARNASPYIAECIESVLAQTFTDFELLIADDGSEDDTCAVVQRFADPRVRLLRLEHNYVATRNRLLCEAQGKYIALLDSDDRMLPQRLALQFDFMERHPEVDALGANVRLFGENVVGRDGDIFAPKRALTLDEMIEGNRIYNPTTMLRRASLEGHHIRYSEKIRNRALRGA